MADRCLIESLKGRQRNTIPANFSRNNQLKSKICSKTKRRVAPKIHVLKYIDKDIYCQPLEQEKI